MIVVAAVQRIGAGLDGLFRVGGPAVEFEQGLIAHEALAFELSGDLRDRRAVGDGDGDLGVLFRQRQHVVGAAPDRHGQQHSHCQHAAHVQQHPDAGRQPRALLFGLLALRLRLLVDGQIRVFLRDLRLKERLHAGLRRFFGGVRRVGRGRIRLFGLRRIAGPVHHRVDAGQIVLDRRQQLIERKLFQTFFQRVLLGRLFVRTGVGVLFSHVFLPYAR